jgi:hypothetical protein
MLLRLFATLLSLARRISASGCCLKLLFQRMPVETIFRQD